MAKDDFKWQSVKPASSGRLRLAAAVTAALTVLGVAFVYGDRYVIAPRTEDAQTAQAPASPPVETKAAPGVQAIDRAVNPASSKALVDATPENPAPLAKRQPLPQVVAVTPSGSADAKPVAPPDRPVNAPVQREAATEPAPPDKPASDVPTAAPATEREPAKAAERPSSRPRVDRPSRRFADGRRPPRSLGFRRPPPNIVPEADGGPGYFDPRSGGFRALRENVLKESFGDDGEREPCRGGC